MDGSNIRQDLIPKLSRVDARLLSELDKVREERGLPSLEEALSEAITSYIRAWQEFKEYDAEMCHLAEREVGR